MADPLMNAPVGHDPAARTADAFRATPRTAPRITGRDAVVAALSASAEVLGATDADLRLKGEALPRRLRPAPHVKEQRDV